MNQVGNQEGVCSDQSDPELGEAVRAYALSLGSELYGVASAAAYKEHFPIKPQPTRFVENARSIIVVGLPFEPGTMSTVLRPELAGLRARASEEIGVSHVQPQGAERFFLAEELAILNDDVLHMGYRMARYLRHRGWHALYFPPAKQNDRFRTAPFYHMPAMYLAGIGTLGLKASILTPEFGPRIWVTSIITDAPLPAGQPLAEELCAHCERCVRNCPIGALDGKGWKNPYACASYGCCATCVAICPVGQE
jgi:epoxyqueuosine reductase QueG